MLLEAKIAENPDYVYSLEYFADISGTGAGGYDMPKSGESFSDYVKRVDPDLYDSMTDIYNEATSGY